MQYFWSDFPSKPNSLSPQPQYSGVSLEEGNLIFCRNVQKPYETRMHSSRMRTARSSSHPEGGIGSPPGAHQEQTPAGADPPGTRYPLGADPPRSRHPLRAGTPPAAGIPQIRHPPGSRPPGLGTPPPRTRQPPRPGTPHPWTEWQTCAKIWPCPKLRLRVVSKGNWVHRGWQPAPQ